VPAADDDVGSVLEEPEGDATPDAAATTRDDHHVAGHVERVRHDREASTVRAT